MDNQEYFAIDNSPLINFLFYPRKHFRPGPDNSFDFTVEVEEGINISCRFYYGNYEDPWILYFHGNGEVVSDYNDIAPFYTRNGLNIVVADYRGYGASNGSPSFYSLINDGHVIFYKVVEKLQKLGWADNIWIMGRSLGSISALELTFNYGDRIKGLIVESGFVSPSNLLEHLGLPSFGLDLKKLEEDSLQKIKNINVPTLIIHGEYDSLIPAKEGEKLFQNIGSEKKEFVLITGAGHNDIMFVGQVSYFGAIKNFVQNKL